ncbi:MAG: peptide ABC transporter substrate-binding protein [Alphaproteobacteria bacterium]|nr:peptide ABC transporter substrate-binding protein [Alphaproteobacteria bacterium]MCB9928572.1 peptide ABC transporter substrate-binding protein [Alphaproteobacteria bacterium]
MLRVALALILALCLAAPAAPAARAEEAKRTLVIGVTQFPSTFHPLIDAMLAKSYVLGMALRPVTGYDRDWQLACLVCETLPTLENGGAVRETTPDGKAGIAVTYRLREGLAWGDGVPVTADDIRFAWEVGKHKDSGVTGADVFQRIWKVETPDARTVILHTDRITYTYNAFGVEPLPAHLERAVFEADPRAYKQRTLYDRETANPGLYFGPYRIAAVSAGAFTTLERNPHWPGPKPYFDRIVVRVIPNTAALEANLLSGAIDYIAGPLGLTLDQALSLQQRRGDAFDFVYKAGLIYEHLDVNLDNPVLADRRVRQALLYGVDRQAISQRLFQGRQPVADSNVSPLDWVHSDDVTRYPYDPEKAKALLTKAGWTPGPGGVRVNGDGQTLSLSLMTTAGARVREQVEQVLQSYWKQIGVETRIRNEPARVFFGQTVRERRFEGLAMFAWISAPESLPRSTLHSTMIPTAENNWAGQNYTGYRNPRVDALLDAIEVDLDRESRRAKWAELQRIYTQDLPALPLYFRANPYVIPKWLKGVRPTGHLAPATLWVEQWRAEGRK